MNLVPVSNIGGAGEHKNYFQTKSAAEAAAPKQPGVTIVPVDGGKGYSVWLDSQKSDQAKISEPLPEGASQLAHEFVDGATKSFESIANFFGAGPKPEASDKKKD